jgi:hypothetical protein
MPSTLGRRFVAVARTGDRRSVNLTTERRLPHGLLGLAALWSAWTGYGW